jgi:hypothetical protein
MGLPAAVLHLFIYNHAGFNTLQQLKQTEDHEIIKISYLKQL